MKKKIVTLMLVGMMTASVTACGSSSDKSTASTTVQSENSSSDETIQEEPVESVSSEKDLPDGDYQDTGDGTFYIACAGGTSEDGNIPVIFADSDLMLMQIGINTEGFNGSALSYIYVDGMLASKEQLADSQMALDLSGDMLSVGIHTVEVVQYESDDTTGNMVTYKSASYEIKSK